ISASFVLACPASSGRFLARPSRNRHGQSLGFCTRQTGGSHQEFGYWSRSFWDTSAQEAGQPVIVRGYVAKAVCVANISTAIPVRLIVATAEADYPALVTLNSELAVVSI